MTDPNAEHRSPVHDVIALIRNRRSVRDFTGRPVPKALVDVIVECGLAAPSSKNSNPWFIVTATGADKDQIASWFREAISEPDGQSERVPVDPLTGSARAGLRDTVAESVQTLERCDTVLLLFNRAPFSRGADTLLAAMQNPETRSSAGKALYGYAGEIIGIGAAAENMLLAARALGLGAVYMADSYPARQRIMRGLQTSRELVGAIAIGYGAYDPTPRVLRREFAASWQDAVGRIDLSVSEQESFWVKNE